MRLMTLLGDTLKNNSNIDYLTHFIIASPSIVNIENSDYGTRQISTQMCSIFISYHEISLAFFT